MIETQAQAEGREEPDGSRFRGHSIFEHATAESLHLSGREDKGEPDWLDDARSEIEERGQYLAFSEGGEHHVVRVEQGWIRIGRSAAAEIRLDDATVSRRHALVVNSDDRGLRVLDDRSLNGISLNGEKVDWGVLDDGDELRVGCFRLFVIDAAVVEAGAS